MKFEKQFFSWIFFAACPLPPCDCSVLCSVEASPRRAVMQSSRQPVSRELLFNRPQEESSRCLWEAFAVPPSGFSPAGCHFSNICFPADSFLLFFFSVYSLSSSHRLTSGKERCLISHDGLL